MKNSAAAPTRSMSLAGTLFGFREKQNLFSLVTLNTVMYVAHRAPGTGHH